VCEKKKLLKGILYIPLAEKRWCGGRKEKQFKFGY